MGNFIISMIVIVLVLASVWVIFEKAGEDGWKSIVPFYSMYVLGVEILKRPVYEFILLFIPLAGTIVWFIWTNELAKSFGKGLGFTLGLIFLPFIFFPILAFDDDASFSLY